MRIKPLKHKSRKQLVPSRMLTEAKRVEIITMEAINRDIIDFHNF